MDYGDGPPRLNFDTFNSAFVTVFVVLTMENWFVVLYDCLRTEQVNQVITIIYLVSWIFIGNFILLNLFLAILLESFSDCETDDTELTPDEMIQAVKAEKEKLSTLEGEHLIRQLITNKAQQL